MLGTYILPNYKAKKMAYRNRLIVLVWSIYTSARPMHQLTAAPGLTDSSDGVSPMAQSTAAAAIDDGQWSKNSTSVAVPQLVHWRLELHALQRSTKFTPAPKHKHAVHYYILPCIAARMTCVARAMRHLVCLPPGSTLHAKKSTKVKGVTERSRQLSAIRTRSSIRPTVPGSKQSYLLVPSTCNAVQSTTTNRSTFISLD